MRHAVVLAALVVTLGPSVARAKQAAAPKVVAEQALTHAWTMFWLTLDEQGERGPIDAGLGYVSQAEGVLKANPRLEGHAVMARKAAALRSALEKQRDLSAGSLRGRFGLTAALGRSLLVDPNALRSYEIVDDADTVAIERMATALRDDIADRWTLHPQHDVLLWSRPANRLLEQKAAFVLAQQPRFNVRTLDELAATLPPAQLKALESPAAGVEPPGPEALARALGAERLIVIELQALDKVADVGFYGLTARLHAPGGPVVRDVISVQGVIRDRKDRAPWLVGLIVALLAGSVGWSVWRTRARQEAGDAAAVAVVGFGAGVLAPHLLWTLVSGIMPEATAPWQITLWWPALVGALVAVGPPLVFSTIARRVSAAMPLMRRALEHHEATSVCLGLGGAAYLARGPLVMAPTAQGVALVAALGLGTIAGARLITGLRAHVVVEPWRLIVALLGVSTMGLGFFSGSIVACALSGGVALAATRWGAAAPSLAPEPDAEEEVALELDDEALRELVRRARRPEYVPATPLIAAREALAPALGKERQARVAWVYLQGQRGSGKTTTAGALAREAGEKAVLLHGACSPSEGGDAGERGKPFEVFADVFEDTVTFGFEEHGEDVLAGIEGSVLDALPIVSMLLPEGDGAGGALSDRGELYARVRRELVKQTRRGTRRVVMWIDDVQWMDPASAELLGALVAAFPPGAPHPIAFIICARRLPALPDACARLLRERQVVVELDEAERRALVAAAVGFDARSAALLDEAVSDTEGKSNLAWLLTLVESVAREGKVRRDDGGQFALTVTSADELPIPESARALVGEVFDGLDESDRFLLHVAVCLGAIFSVEVLSSVVERPRLEVITALDRLARATGLVEDSWDTDDAFRFTSAQRFLALREHLGVRDLHPRLQQAQIVRDIHLKIARVLEDQRADVADIAHHYYHAGRRDLGRALHFCRRAAQSARDVFAFDGYALQLERAATCAELLAATTRDEETRAEAVATRAEIGQALAILPYERAHVLGEPALRKARADEAIAQLRQWTDEQVLGDVPIPLLIAMTRACYEDRRFEQAEQMARHLEALGAAAQRRAQRTLDEELAYIEGMHFIGLSLPTSQPERRLDWLQRARAAVEALEHPDSRALAIQARVYNSLAEQLSQRATYDFDAALKWFERSVTLKNMLRPPDKPGLARAFGGLGRLHLYAAPASDAPEADPEAIADHLRRAQSYFEKDLDLCRDYGDVAGECQILSHLGEVAIRQGDPARALRHYTASAAQATDVNLAFATLGVLEAHLLLSQTDPDHIPLAAQAAEAARALTLPKFLVKRAETLLGLTPGPSPAEPERGDSPPQPVDELSS